MEFANALALVPAVLSRLPVGLADCLPPCPPEFLEEMLPCSLINRARGRNSGRMGMDRAKLDMTAFFRALAFQDCTGTALSVYST